MPAAAATTSAGPCADPVATLSVAITDLQGSLRNCVQAFQAVTTDLGSAAEVDQLRKQNALQAARIAELEATVAALQAADPKASKDLSFEAANARRPVTPPRLPVVTKQQQRPAAAGKPAVVAATPPLHLLSAAQTQPSAPDGGGDGGDAAGGQIYYEQADQKAGPVSPTELAELIRGGSVNAETFVWTKAMGASWDALGEAAPDFFPAFIVVRALAKRTAAPRASQTSRGEAHEKALSRCDPPFRHPAA
eukprot:SAG22_NODE_511_length_9594_cov_4.553449_12_plen_250_part_00